MAPLPKRRHSSRRQAKRQRALLPVSVTLVECKQCGKLTVPHRVCKFCGFYNGRSVVVKKEKAQQKSK